MHQFKRKLTLHWSTAKPTVPGFYWYKFKNEEPQIVTVYEGYEDGKLVVDTFDAMQQVPVEQEGGGQWAGPLTPPED